MASECIYVQLDYGWAKFALEALTSFLAFFDECVGMFSQMEAKQEVEIENLMTFDFGLGRALFINRQWRQ